MSKLNLSQTCLLDISGELGEKARVQLHEHVKEYPAALLEYQVVKGQYDLLRSIPKVELSEERKRFLAAQIKQGIHRKLTERENRKNANRRWKMIYHGLAGASALAACLVVYFSINYFKTQMDQERHLALVKAEQERHSALVKAELAEQAMRNYLESDNSNMTDFVFNDMADQINLAEARHNTANDDSDLPEATLLRLTTDLDQGSGEIPEKSGN